MNRRGLLAAAGGLLSAGCLSRWRGSRLGRLVVANFTPSPISVVVRVLDGDSAVYEGTHDIEAHDGGMTVPSAAVQEELPDEPRQYVIEYGLVGEQRETFDFSEYVPTGCGQIHINVREDRRIEVLYSKSCDTIDYTEQPTQRS